MCVSVDPLVATGNPANTVHRSIAAPGSVPGMPLPPVSPAAQSLLAAQQELLYRELMSRAPYVNDPVLTQQVTICVIFINRTCTWSTATITYRCLQQFKNMKVT